MLTTKNYGIDEQEKNVNWKRCEAVINQLFKTLEECDLGKDVKVMEAYLKLKAEIKQAVK